MRSFFQRKGLSGFTLIELLVVIAIIGVLASIVLASLNSARRKSRDARRITDIKQLQLALELYYDAPLAGETQQYPDAIAETPGCANLRGLDVLATRGFIPQVPRDPLGSCYFYAHGGTPHTTYHLGGVLEEATNPAFNSDKDCDSSITGGSAGACSVQTGLAFGPTLNHINGTNDSTDRIYDVVP